MRKVWSPTLHIPGMVMDAWNLIICERQEGVEFKVIHGYIWSSRLTWDTRDCLNNEEINFYCLGLQGLEVGGRYLAMLELNLR